MQYFITLEEPSAVWLSVSLLDDKIDSNLMHAKFINYLDKNYIKLSEKINIMSNGELIKELTDFTANGSFESLNKNVKYTDEKGIPFIRIKNMSENGLEMEDVKYITEETYEYLNKSKLQGDEVLFSKTGANLGLAMVFPNNFGKVSLADNTFKITYKDMYDNHYLVSFFNCKYGKLWVERLSQGSAQPTIIKESFRQIKVPIPSYEIQKYIGNKVRKAEELKEEAKELKKKAEKIIDRYLGEITLNIEKKYSTNFLNQNIIEERIDSEYYNDKYFKLYKELNKKGYIIKTLKDLCDGNIINGKTYKVTSDKRKYMNIGVGELGDWYVKKNSEKYVDENINLKYVVKKNSIMWGNSAHLAKYIGEKVSIVLDENLYIPTTEVTYITPNSDKINSYYLFLYMKSKWGYYQIQRTIKGMTAHSYPEDISKIKVPIINFTLEELKILEHAVELGNVNISKSNELIKEAKQDIENLIEGNFDMSKIRKTN